MDDNLLITDLQQAGF